MNTGPEEMMHQIIEELERTPTKKLSYPELRKKFVREKGCESADLIRSLYILERSFRIYRHEEIEEANCFVALTYPPEKPVGDDLFAELFEEAKKP